MEIRLPDGKIVKARITRDTLDGEWAVVGLEGSEIIARTREDMARQGIQITQTTALEYAALGRAGISPGSW